MTFPVSEAVATLLANILFDVVFPKGLVLALVAILLGVSVRRMSAGGRAAVWTATLVSLVALSLPVVPWFLHTGIPRIWDIELAAFPQGLFKQTVPGLTLGDEPASVAAWLGLVWVAGALMLLVRFGLSLARIAAITRRSRPLPSAGFERSVRAALAGCPRSASIRVRLTHELGVPVTWGLLQPVILLPVSARAWSVDLLRAVLRHEAAHVARRDYLALLVFHIARAVHWPNPLVWIVVRQARLDQERACDDAALDDGITPAEYARHLVTVARTALVPSTVSAALPMARKSVLRNRVRDIMRPDADRRPVNRRTVAVAFLVMTLVAAQLSLSNLWECPLANGAAQGEVSPPPPTGS